MSKVLDRELQVATKVAYRFGARWELVEPEDLASHLTLWLFDNAQILAAWREVDYGTGQLYVSLKREAARYCAAETASRIGRPIANARFYSLARIRRVLPFIFETIPEPQVMENPKTGEAVGIASENIAQAVILDLRDAYYGLPRKTRNLVTLRYRDGLSYREIAELHNLSVEAAQTAIHRALKRMGDSLESNKVGTQE
jgi:RNA polymerase sigma factor (sigma-70 family)